jgi:hypothetical protein
LLFDNGTAKRRTLRLAGVKAVGIAVPFGRPEFVLKAMCGNVLPAETPDVSQRGIPKIKIHQMPRLPMSLTATDVKNGLLVQESARPAGRSQLYTEDCSGLSN